MSEIKQVWGIIKDYQCADLKMVQEPALAVWKSQQAIIDDLRSQLNNMETCYIGKKQQVDDCAALAKEWRTLAREMCPLDDKYVIGARLGCAQDIEEVLRGEHE